jgi:hypothetical protein
MTTLADHLALAQNWILGAELDIPELERQLAEAERNLPTTAQQHNAATANVRAILGTGPDSVPFRSETERQVAAYQAVTESRAVKTTLLQAQQAIDVLKAKLANRRTDLMQARSLHQRIELAMQADELPTVMDELETLLEN